jgi:hypothetical protein
MFGVAVRRPEIRSVFAAADELVAVTLCADVNGGDEA